MKPQEPQRIFSNLDLSRLIIPLIIEQFLSCLVGMVDTMMISSVGEEAVSGVSLVDLFNILIINVFAALSTGGAVVASQYLGAKRRSDAQGATKQLLIVTLAVSLLLLLLAQLFNRQLIGLFFGSIEAGVMSSARSYFRITALAFPAIALFNACAAIFRVMGNSKISMFGSLLCNVINVLGNALLIYVLRWGVAGAAWATVLSRIAAMLLLLFLLSQRQHSLYLSWRDGFRPHLATIRKILYIGIPNGIENSFFQLGRILVLSVIARFGTQQIAAAAVAGNLGYLSCIAAGGFSLAMVPVIGHCVGNGNREQLYYYVRKMMRLAYTVHLLWGGMILLLAPLLLRFYALPAETLRLAYILILIHNIFSLFMWPASFVFPNALRAANDVTYTMMVSVLSMLIMRIGFSHVLGYGLGWGAIGVWLAMVMDWVLRISCFYWRYRSGNWLRRAGLAEG
jgi:putative MATE family efflux protein